MQAVVRLLGMPVRSWLRLQEHTDALMREYRLITQQGAEHVPRELLALFAAVQAEFPESGVPEMRGGIKAAFDAGQTTADVEVVMTSTQAEMMSSLHVLLMQIDGYCRDGVLLTLPLEEEITRLRGWVVEEVARQLKACEPRVYDGPVTA